MATKRTDRRRFLKGAAAGALAAQAPLAAAQQLVGTFSAEKAGATSEKAELLINERPGADFMLEVIKSLGIEYVAANPASGCRGLHESIVNYGGNTKPELLTCCHEESPRATWQETEVRPSPRDTGKLLIRDSVRQYFPS